MMRERLAHAGNPPSGRFSRGVFGAGLVALFATILSSGCATPSLMRLSDRTPSRAGETVWWVSSDPAGTSAPLLGIEHRVDRRLSEQVVLSQRGFRRFRYSWGRLVRASAPLPASGACSDMAMVRWALEHYQNNPAGAGASTLWSIPPVALAAIASMQEIVDLCDRHWAGARVEPTMGLTYREINVELEHFPHGAFQLAEASEAF